MAAIAGVNNRNFSIVGHRARSPVPVMAHDQQVCIVCNHPCRICDRLPFCGRRGSHVRRTDHRPTEALHGRFKRKPSSSAGLVKKRCHDLSGTDVAPGSRPARAVHAVRDIEDLLDLLVAKILDGDEISSRQDRILSCSRAHGTGVQLGNGYLIDAVRFFK